MDFDRQQKALKELFAKGEAPSDSALFKLTIPDHVKSETLSGLQRKFTFIISSGALDRDGDTVDPHAWDTKNFMDAGGPVLFAHKADQPPVGKTERIYNAGGKLKAEHMTPPRGAYPFADTISDLVDFGALKATSVGFKPKGGKTERNDKGGYDFSGQELLEWSIVPIPSNPEALREAKRANVGDFRPLKDWAERVLEEVEGSGLWLPKAAVENVLKIASGEKVTISLSPKVTVKVPAAGAAEVSASDGTTHAAAGTPKAALPLISKGDREYERDDIGRFGAGGGGSDGGLAAARAEAAATPPKKPKRENAASRAEAMRARFPAAHAAGDAFAARHGRRRTGKEMMAEFLKGEPVSTTKAAPPPPPANAPTPPANAAPAAAPAAPMTLQAAIDAGAGSIVEAFTNAVQSVADAKPDNAEELLQGIADEFTAMALASIGAAAAAAPAPDGGAPAAAAEADKGGGGKTPPPPPPKKAGRVLSRANEEALTMAVGVIQQILGQVKPPKPADAAEDGEHELPPIGATATLDQDPDHKLPTPGASRGSVNGEESADDKVLDAQGVEAVAKPAASQVYREPAAATSGAGAPNEGARNYGKDVDPSTLFAFAPDGAVVPLTKAPAEERVEVTPALIKSLVRDTLAAERAKSRGRLPD
jgi:hypothetical protein